MSNWDNLTALEQAATIYSDAHKAAYGFRPRDGGIHRPVTLTDYDSAIEECILTMQRNAAEEARHEASARAAFEAEIATLMGDHHIDRATALRWWFEAEGWEPREHIGWARQDAEHILWGRGIGFDDWPAIMDLFLPLPQAA